MKIYFKKPKAQEMLDSKITQGLLINTKIIRNSFLITVLIMTVFTVGKILTNINSYIVEVQEK